jgi:hypothetical protein
VFGTFQEVAELTDSQRGVGGFGSTGIVGSWQLIDVSIFINIVFYIQRKLSIIENNQV